MRLTLSRAAFGLHAEPFFLPFARRISKQSGGRPGSVAIVRTDDGQGTNRDPKGTNTGSKTPRRTSSTVWPLTPQISSMKARVEALMASSATPDTLIFPKEGTYPGVTDLAIEKRSDEVGSTRLVSIYFDSSPDGLKSYRQAAASLSACPEAKMHFTPHLGQSRISIEWADFWSMLSSNSDSLRLFSPQIALPPPSPSNTD